MIEYRGALAEADLRTALRLRRRVLADGGSARDGLLWLGIGFALLPIWIYFSGPVRDPATFWWLPFSFCCLALWWRRRASFLEQWRRIAEAGAEQHGRVTESALEARLAGVDARIPWVFFSSRLSAGGALLLLVGTHIQLLLAASQFQNEDEWRRARELIAQRVPEPTQSSLLTRTGLWLFFLVVVFLLWHFARIKK